IPTDLTKKCGSRLAGFGDDGRFQGPATEHARHRDAVPANGRPMFTIYADEVESDRHDRHDDWHRAQPAPRRAKKPGREAGLLLFSNGAKDQLAAAGTNFAAMPSSGLKVCLARSV